MKHQRLHNLKYLKQTRRNLRKNATPAEAALWNLLKNKSLRGAKFRRQHSIGNYIVDFYCPYRSLAIEVDGSIHHQPAQAQYDLERTRYLESHGVTVIRFDNKSVFEQPENVLTEIAKHLW